MGGGCVLTLSRVHKIWGGWLPRGGPMAAAAAAAAALEWSCFGVHLAQALATVTSHELGRLDHLARAGSARVAAEAPSALACCVMAAPTHCKAAALSCAAVVAYRRLHLDKRRCVSRRLAPAPPPPPRSHQLLIANVGAGRWRFMRSKSCRSLGIFATAWSH